MKKMFMAVIGSILLFTSAYAKTTLVTTPTPTLSPLHSIPVTDAAGYLTNGTLDVISFIASNGSLWAVCKLRGIVGGIEIDEDCICPIEVNPCDDIRLDMNATQLQITTAQQAQAFHCCVEIRFGTCNVPRITSLTLNPHNVQCTIRDYLEHILCAINNTPRILTGQLVGLLNQLL
jgi:hypothetical protein